MRDRDVARRRSPASDWRLARRRIQAAGLALALGAFVLSGGAVRAETAGESDRLAEGIAAYRAGEFERARDVWLSLAEAGDAVAQYNLGKLYEHGGGALRQDYALAARWYREAAAQGIAEAQNNLALMHAQGRGVPRDPARAAELWRQAATAGYALAQYNLGLAYFRGAGLARDERQAASWLRLAADGGLADAQYAMGQMKRLGRVGPQDDAEALTWYRLAAAQGHEAAAEQAGRLEARGIAPTPVPAGQGDMAGMSVPESAPHGSGEPAMPPPPDVAHAEEADPNPTADAEQSEDPSGVRTNEPTEAALPEPAAEPALETAAPTDPPPVEQPVLEDRTAAGAPGGGYRVWLFSADSEAAAESLRAGAEQRHGALFDGARLALAEVDYGALGHFYRVVAGPVADRRAAEDLCRRLRAAEPGAFCKVVRP